MNDPNTSNQELGQVINYIETIKSYEIRTFRDVASMINLIWGTLFIQAGVLDYIFLSNNLSIYLILVWAFPSVGGVFYWAIFSRYTKKYEKEPTVTSKVNRRFQLIFIVITFAAWVFISLLIILQLYYFITPLVGIIFGIVITLSIIQDKDVSFLHFGRKFLVYSVGVLPFLVGTLTLILALIYGNKLVVFFGLSLGLGFGIPMFFSGLLELMDSKS